MGNVFTSALHSNTHSATLTEQKTLFPLLLLNRRAYRGAAYELPEQIHYNINSEGKYFKHNQTHDRLSEISLYRINPVTCHTLFYV
jgi:hypothetical protein